MEAIHTFWGIPNKAKNNGKVFISDLEMLVMILSAVEWKKQNGRIIMVTDSEGYKYFEENKLLSLWGDCRTDLDGLININPSAFWAAGKLYALDKINKPCVMLDTDMIIWKKLDYLWSLDVVAAHKEDLSDSVYPDPSKFEYKDNIVIYPPKVWDYTIPAMNTAFLYIKNESFAKYYVNWSFAYMERLKTENLTPAQSMCFVEQRLLPLCAKEKNIEINTLLDDKKLDKQDLVTHLWGAKNYISQSSELNDSLCRRCVERIKTEDPDFYKKLIFNQRFDKYINAADISFKLGQIIGGLFNGIK